MQLGRLEIMDQAAVNHVSKISQVENLEKKHTVEPDEQYKNLSEQVNQIKSNEVILDNIKFGFDKESGMSMVKKKSSGVWWYVDTTGKMYYFKLADLHFDFSEGLAKGGINDKYGYLNNKGEWEIVPAFNDVKKFRNGFAAAKMGNRWGLINKKGEWVLQPEYKDSRESASEWSG